jgi:hypothetical protein
MSKADNAVSDNPGEAVKPRRRGKNIKRKTPQVVQLTDRDIRILKALSPGPAILDRLLTIVREEPSQLIIPLFHSTVSVCLSVIASSPIVRRAGTN